MKKRFEHEKIREKKRERKVDRPRYNSHRCFSLSLSLVDSYLCETNRRVMENNLFFGCSLSSTKLHHEQKTFFTLESIVLSQKEKGLLSSSLSQQNPFLFIGHVSPSILMRRRANRFQFVILFCRRSIERSLVSFSLSSFLSN